MTYKKVAIISHVYSPGPPHELAAYLLDKVSELYFIAHPLDFLKATRSVYRYYKDGKLIYEKTGRTWPLPGPLIYLKDMLANLYWGLFVMPKLDLIVALDNLNATSSIWLRLLGRVKKVVFYTIDYVPQRFSNRLLNTLYHGLDNYSVRRADWVWNLSPIMADMREKKGIEQRYRSKQLTVPIGTHLLPIEKVKKDPHLVIFMGHLREGQGADLLLDAMALVVTKNPKMRLRLIGGGPLLEPLKAQAGKLKIAHAIQFTGFVPTNEEMRALLLEGTVAVAPYVDDEKTYTRYTDPGKPKEYLAAGLPVIITTVPAIATTIHKRKAGLAIHYNKNELAEAILQLIESKELMTYRKNAKALARESTWDNIFSRVFQEMK